MLKQRTTSAGDGSNERSTAKWKSKKNTNTHTKQLSEDKLDSFERLFGFKLTDLTSWNSFVRLLFRPSDPACLGVVRALFGLLMILDIPEERGLADADVKWGDPNECRFPLFNFLKPLPLEWMCLVYLVMWVGAFGIMLGLRFRLSCLAFIIPYWYILLLDKSAWNNHSYLYGLVSILLLGSHAHYFWSVDGLRNRVPKNAYIPLWNYTILRYQFFILYFVAGLKKFDSEWLGGYSMTNLSYHWVFEPFRPFLTAEQIDFWIVHVCGFLLDLTISFWLFFDVTRPVAMFFCASFHLMNSRMFTIGMFPYVCLATMPLFCHMDWPRHAAIWVEEHLTAILRLPVSYLRLPWRAGTSPKQSASCCIQPITMTNDKKGKGNPKEESRLTLRHHLTAALLLSHMGLQAFLPYSHFITKGYNNWTNGLYGYSWDMMVHSWDTILVVVKVVDKETGKEHFLDPEAWVQSDRWTKHADMAVQYATCVGERLKDAAQTNSSSLGKKPKFDNSTSVAVHVDVWCSLNGRFQQRVFDPRTDILSVADQWSPFHSVPWLMPLLDDKPSFYGWKTESGLRRGKMREIMEHVHSWSPYSDVLFVADFPGLVLENYMAPDLGNVTLTVLSGKVRFEVKDTPETRGPRTGRKGEMQHSNRYPQFKSKNVTLSAGESSFVPTSTFHYVHTISESPSFYMYTYYNITRKRLGIRDGMMLENKTASTFQEEVQIRVTNFGRALAFVGNSILKLIYSVPMIRRVRVA